jgi:hypothetical protein
MCIGDLFDGTANMSGVYNGLKALLNKAVLAMSTPGVMRA